MTVNRSVHVRAIAAMALCAVALLTSCGSSGGSDEKPGTDVPDGERTTVDLENGYAISFVLPDGWEGFSCQDLIDGKVPGRELDEMCDPENGGMLYEIAEKGVSLVDSEGGTVNDDTCDVGKGYLYPQNSSIDEVDPGAGESFGPEGDWILWTFDQEPDPCPGGRLDIPTGDTYVRLLIEGPAMTKADYRAFMGTVSIDQT